MNDFAWAGLCFALVIAIGVYSCLTEADHVARLRKLAENCHGQLVRYADGIYSTGSKDGCQIGTRYNYKIILPNGRDWFDPEHNPQP